MPTLVGQLGPPLDAHEQLKPVVAVPAGPITVRIAEPSNIG
ncbi:hypothetical protein IQ25_00854 [Novosphingobium taihuense]|uniref:Uncharacterized protein n=1 Tax=Novosphingobium taihuense TaxID=260085 RepID=A0A7W7EU22_9SPHN|nr:hypothetical protein [Novosphingobium taihuense]TWH88731.1 hypothetical protein IQ25_00854 [Novosphingobium taihuense]